MISNFSASLSIMSQRSLLQSRDVVNFPIDPLSWHMERTEKVRIYTCSCHFCKKTKNLEVFSVPIKKQWTILKVIPFMPSVPYTGHLQTVKPRSDAAECAVWSGSKWFAFNTRISMARGINKYLLDTHSTLTLILLINLISHTHFWLSANQITSYNLFVQIHNLNGKQCRSWSDGFFTARELQEKCQEQKRFWRSVVRDVRKLEVRLSYQI